MKTPFSTRTKEHALRGHIRLFPLLFTLALLPTLLVPMLAEVPVYNPAQPSPWIPPLLAAGGILLIWILPTPPSVLFVSLLLAGSTANILHSHIAPVPDYIAVPLSTDHYMNMADVLLVGALLTLPWVVRGGIEKYWNYRD